MQTNESSLTVEEIQQNVELAKEAARKAVSDMVEMFCEAARSAVSAVYGNSERGAGSKPNLALGPWQNDKVCVQNFLVNFCLTDFLTLKGFPLMR